jgi:arylsulfatase A-like enzyme
VPGANVPPEGPCPHDKAAAQLSEDPSPALPLYHTLAPDCGGVSCNASIIAQPLNLTTLSDNYAAWASAFIAAHAAPGSNPFFLYLAESHIHVPLGHDPRFTNASRRGGIFADTLLELDATVGAVMAAVAAAGLENDTLVWYTTDNGPWNVKCDLCGSQGPFDGAYQAVSTGWGEAGGGGEPWRYQRLQIA